MIHYQKKKQIDLSEAKLPKQLSDTYAEKYAAFLRAAEAHVLDFSSEYLPVTDIHHAFLFSDFVLLQLLLSFF